MLHLSPTATNHQANPAFIPKQFRVNTIFAPTSFLRNPVVVGPWPGKTVTAVEVRHLRCLDILLLRCLRPLTLSSRPAGVAVPSTSLATTVQQRGFRCRAARSRRTCSTERACERHRPTRWTQVENIGRSIGTMERRATCHDTTIVSQFEATAMLVQGPPPFAETELSECKRGPACCAQKSVADGPKRRPRSFAASPQPTPVMPPFPGMQQPMTLKSRFWKVLPREAWTVPLLPRTMCWVTHVSAECCPFHRVD